MKLFKLCSGVHILLAKYTMTYNNLITLKCIILFITYRILIVLFNLKSRTSTEILTTDATFYYDRILKIYHNVV